MSNSFVKGQWGQYPKLGQSPRLPMPATGRVKEDRFFLVDLISDRVLNLTKLSLTFIRQRKLKSLRDLLYKP